MAQANERFKSGQDELTRRYYNNAQSYHMLATKCWLEMRKIRNCHE
jgi:hypothetical protein